MVYGFWGAGHREPNRDDYTQSSPASRPLAEKLSDSEAGFRYQNQDFSANLNLFYMEYKDQLVLDGSINEVGAYTRINVPDSYRAGLELEAKWRPTHQLQLSGNVAFSRNKIKEFTEFIDDWDTGGQLTRTYRNTDLAFSPALISRGDLNFILFERKTTTDKIKSVSLNLGGKYVSKQFLDNTSNEQAVLAGYFTGDLRVNALVPTRKGPDFNLIFSINNLFNQKYESNGWIYRFQSAGYDPRPDDPYSALESNSTYHLAGYFPQAGRNWALTLQARF